jgi:hypothetical protein
MDEKEWLTSNTAPALIDFVRRRASKRKLRLFACAASRRILHMVEDDGIRQALEVGERYGDGQAEAAKRKWIGERAMALANAIPLGIVGGNAARTMALAAAKDAQEAAERAAQWASDAELVREHFGNPYRRLTVRAPVLAWQDDTVVRLARTTYDERILPGGTLDNTRLAILADALEEAGCTEEAILLHLRNGERHYRGCWVIDLLLGKN